MTATALEPKPDDYIQTELQKFNVTDAAIAEMRENYLTIKVVDFNDKENAALARSRRLEVKTLRVATDKMREEMKADSIKFGKAVEKKAQSIIKPLAEIEAYLQEQEDIVAKHKERQEAAERARIAAEQETERQRLEAERAALEAERAEIERQKAEIEAARQRGAGSLATPTPAVSVAPPSGVLKIRVYYHASKETLYQKGKDAGLSEQAAESFMYAGEVGVELEVDAVTGEVKSTQLLT